MQKIIGIFLGNNFGTILNITVTKLHDQFTEQGHHKKKQED